MRQAKREWASRNRTKVRNRVKARNAAICKTAKDKPCMNCGDEHPHYKMDFDHRDGETKSGNVAVMCHAGASIQRLLDEIAKCDVICANCHRERTWQRQQVKGTLPLPEINLGRLSREIAG